MSYSRRRGGRQRAYKPTSWADEQEELRLIRQQEAKRAAAATTPAPATPPPTADHPDHQART